MTEQTNTPKLRFPEFKNEWSYDLLGDVVTNKSKKFDPKKEEATKDIELDSIEQNTGRLLDTYISNDFTSQKNKFKKDNVLYSKLRPYLNKYYYATIDGVCSSEIWVLNTLNKDVLVNKFLYYFIQTNRFSSVTNKSAGSKMPRADWELVKNIRLYKGSIKEQEKIGYFFSKLDQQIELEEKKLELLEQQKRGYMQKLFSQELRFKDKNGNKYPEWQLKNLSELGETFTGLSGKTKNDFGYGDGLFITYMNVFKNTIAKSDMVERVKIEANENQNKVQYGDILFTTSSEVPNEVGMSSIWLFNQDNVYLNSFCFGFRVVVNYIKPVYLARYLRSEEMRKTITILAQGSTRFNISKKEMMKLNIKVPYIEEQIKIDNFFNKIDTLILKQGKKIELLKQRKQGLLQKMFV
ncbi:type I restriction enzyme, S subunit [Staphylococcus hominis]